MKSIIKQELEGKEKNRFPSYPKIIFYDKENVNSAIQKALEEAEKRIDEQIETAQQIMSFDIEKKGMYLQIIDEWRKAKQILNDCFGAGK